MRLMIAGGGTGGHLFPGIALAEEVITRHPKNEVLFVGTQRGLEARVVPSLGFRLETIEVGGLKGMGLFKFLKNMFALPRAFLQSVGILQKYQPDVVVGVGGYASGPVVFAAWLLGIPTAIQEQNALAGLTNRLLGKCVRAIFISFDEARAYFPKRKTHLIGNPVRRALLENFLRSTLKHEKFSVLIFGGSLGARGLNDRVIDSLSYLDGLQSNFHFIHQTGKADSARVQKAYAEKGFEADVREFIDDMSTAYALSDLVVCRAGATTLAELTVCKKAAILVPFPFATDDHQAVNARAMVDSGAAVMFRESELTGEKLALQLRDFMSDKSRLASMEKKAALLGRPEAAKELADVCVKMMIQTYGPKGRERSSTEVLRQEKMKP